MAPYKRCIYCLESSGSSKNVPHALPEAVYRGGPAFPVGVICDKCNEYLGTKLETMLVKHPVVSMQMQSYGIPGKKGVRRQLGVFERTQGDHPTLSFPVAEPKFRYNKQGIRIGFTVMPLWDPHFDMDRFSRGLHMIAFNLAVLRRGIDTAFDAHYDRVRRYIREPGKGERWPFLQVIGPHTAVKLVPEVRPVECEGADLVKIELFNVIWWVDLQNSGVLRRDQVRVESNGDTSWDLVDSNWKPPKDEPIMKDGEQVVYRAVIR